MLEVGNKLYDILKYLMLPLFLFTSSQRISGVENKDLIDEIPGDNFPYIREG